MKLLRLHIENFGRLCNYDLTLDDGLNILHEKNGWGKSTLAAFIKAMLYGLPSTSKQRLDENERKKYAPWQGGAFGGSLEFETHDGAFRAERFFAAKESGDSFALFDLATNKPSKRYTSALGEELFGIDADGFTRTTYLSQLPPYGQKRDKLRDNNSIAAKLGDLLDDVGDIGNYDTAMEALEKRRRYYVLTGNRGAIADLEREYTERLAALEQLRETEKCLRAEEAELAITSQKLLDTQAKADQNRTQLTNAGLIRERQAHLEQKSKLLAELAERNEKMQHIEAFFGGRLPTDEEMRESRDLYERIRETSMRLSLTPDRPADPDTLERLSKVFANGTPSRDTLERANAEARTLRELCAKRAVLEERLGDDPTARRFAGGIPSQPRLDAAFEALSHADALQKSIEGFSKSATPQKTSSVPVAFAAFFIAFGVFLAVLSLLPALAAFSVLFLSLGGVSLAGGLIFLILSLHAKSTAKKNAGAMQQKLDEWQSKREKELETVRTLLAAYRMPTDDLSRSLTELTLLTTQYAARLEERRKTQAALEATAQQIAACTASLSATLAPYYNALEYKENYALALERLQADTAEYARLLQAEQKRKQVRAQLEEQLQAQKEQLLPFLRRYDTKSTMKAGECLSHIEAQRNAHMHLLEELARLEQTLKRFIAEKQLDRPLDTAGNADFDTLNAEASTLQASLEALQHRQASQTSAMERLSADVDRIPEQEALLAQLKERIDEAKANAATVKNTARFLEEAKTALSTRYLGGMQQGFEAHLAALTDGQAPESVMDTSFEVSLREVGKTRPMEAFSRGWRDAVDFCTRLALTDALYADSEPPFLLLDDPFVNLDDTRLAAARRLLDSLSHRYQILYLVCHGDRA